ALILRILAVEDRVGRALLEPRGRQRIGREQREAVRAETVPRNHVARERLAGERVLDDLRAVEEAVVRDQQLAEITGPHLGRGDGGGVGLHLQEVDPFLRAEEEQLVLQDRAAQRVAILLVVERRRPTVAELRAVL